MSLSWVRLWHEMPSDPKWRVVARKSNQPVAHVIALFVYMMVEASRAEERGLISGVRIAEAAALLDLNEQTVAAILEAMNGLVHDGKRLSGWKARQPLREDDSTARVQAHRKRKANGVKRTVTQRNAPDEDAETDVDKDGDIEAESTAAVGDDERAHCLAVCKVTGIDASSPKRWREVVKYTRAWREAGLADGYVLQWLSGIRKGWDESDPPTSIKAFTFSMGQILAAIQQLRERNAAEASVHAAHSTT